MKARRRIKFICFVIYALSFLGIIVSSTIAANDSKKNLTESGVAPTVVVPDNVDIVTEFAAEELRDYLAKILDVDIRRVSESEFCNNSPAFHVGWTKKANKFAADARKLKDDGFLLRRVGDTVFIVGPNKRGILYGVYGLLEEHLGCRWPKPDPISEIVPKLDNLTLIDLEDKQEPDMPVRGVMTAFGRRELNDDMMQNVVDFIAWQARQRMNIFTSFVNPDSPESLAWVGELLQADNSRLLKCIQKRGFVIDYSTHSFRRFSGKEKNIDMSNPKIERIFVRNVKKTVEKYPFFDVIGLWMSDGWHGATLNTPEACSLDNPPRYITKSVDWAAFEPKFCITNTYVDFVNRVVSEVRKSHPALDFSILAYNRSILAPKDVECDPSIRTNVAFRRSESYYIGDSRSEWNRRQNNELLDWLKACDHVVLYEYYETGGNAMLARPWPRVIAKDLAYLKKIGAEGTISQASWNHFGNFGMNFYVYAKCSWNTTYDVSTVLQDYYDSVYGPAASVVQKIYDEWENALNKGGDYFRNDYTKFLPLLTPELRASMKQRAIEAVQLVDNNKQATGYNRQVVAEVKIIADAVDRFCCYVAAPSPAEKAALKALDAKYDCVYFNFRRLDKLMEIATKGY
jgi:hypothetical protein